MIRTLPDGIELDDDPSRVDVDAVHGFLAEEAYWVLGRSRAEVERLVVGSTRVIAAYDGENLVGFCRVVSDASSMAWLGDVFVVEGYRGRGIATEMVREAVEYPAHRDCYWYLNTLDAHGLYAKVGFVVADPARTMVRPRRVD
jgi:GNAT superfamily N-acetyltransferase